MITGKSGENHGCRRTGHSHTVKPHLTSLLFGIGITALTMTVPYEYCMDGPGRGFPFAVYSPACGAWVPVVAFDGSKIPQVLDLGGLVGDAVVWGTAVALLRRWHSRRLARTGKCAPSTSSAA
jgi:hypothetical protein